ncbi:hypothetical protein ABEB36_012752 [Hypothenemus hampei]|uniref:Uncharacterized protein n=1 Tax=Hypothenemus hampei TaxID=57062 RepID=A0ABD1EC99_HYPHA
MQGKMSFIVNLGFGYYAFGAFITMPQTRRSHRTHMLQERNRRRRHQLPYTNFTSQFEDELNSIQYFECSKCSKKFPDIKLSRNICISYSKITTTNLYTSENNMEPGEVPEELIGLTIVEEILIS